MFESFKLWVESLLDGSYEISPGQWVEDEQTEGRNFCVLRMGGGPGPIVDTRKANLQVTLLGPRGKRLAHKKLLADAEILISAALEDGREVPCGAANIRSLGEPVGPGYTTENRAWVSFSFELIF